MWYKITESGQSSLSVGKHLITKDPRVSVAHYSFDHGLSPAKWDLHITDVRLSDAARYQCHVMQKDGHVSARSNVKLVVEGRKTERETSTYGDPLDADPNRRRSSTAAYRRTEIIAVQPQWKTKQISTSDKMICMNDEQGNETFDIAEKSLQE